MNTNKFFIPRTILLILALAIVLNIGRILIFDSVSFIYLYWNIFLAILPFVASSILLWFAKNRSLPNIFLIIGGLAWLLLLPNAPYIVTDLIHIGHSQNVLVLYDTFLLFTCAWTGLLLALYSIGHMDKLIQMKYGRRAASVAISIILLVASFGMYLGRFLRFNSWDVFYDHMSLLENIWKIFSQPENYKNAYIFTGVAFLFLYISYKAFKYSTSETKPSI